jgi:hypothetical protein
MNEANLDLQTLAARLRKLEKRDRIWRLVVVIALLLVIAFPATWFMMEGSSLESRSYVLVDAHGKRRAVLGTSEDGSPSLVFYDKDGRILVLANTKGDGTSSLALYDKNGTVLFKAP